jgi:hypothetical protein
VATTRGEGSLVDKGRHGVGVLRAAEQVAMDTVAPELVAQGVLTGIANRTG